MSPFLFESDPARWIAEAFDEFIGLYVTFGRMYGPFREGLSGMAEAYSFYRSRLPGLLITAIISCSLLQYITARTVLSRMGYEIEALPRFETWRTPRAASVIWIAAAMASVGLRNSARLASGYLVAVNAWTVLDMLILVHGMAVSWWFMGNRLRLFKPLRILVLVVAPFTIIGFNVLVLGGVLDCIFDFRRIRARPGSGQYTPTGMVGSGSLPGPEPDPPPSSLSVMEDTG